MQAIASRVVNHSNLPSAVNHRPTSPVSSLPLPLIFLWPSCCIFPSPRCPCFGCRCLHTHHCHLPCPHTLLSPACLRPILLSHPLPCCPLPSLSPLPTQSTPATSCLLSPTSTPSPTVHRCLAPPFPLPPFMPITKSHLTSFPSSPVAFH